MSSKDLFSEPFSEETITKLEIFEQYAESWLPVFLFKNFKEILICDFFAGAGADKLDVPGSPLRILNVLSKHEENIIKNNSIVNLLFNELDKDKFLILKENINKKLKKMTTLSKHVRVNVENENFNDLFHFTIKNSKKSANLIFLDQNGVKEISKEIFHELINLSTTDFMFFISSSFFHRFKHEGNRFFDNSNLTDVEDYEYFKIHMIILEEYKKMIPPNNSTKLYPFTIKKGANIYGLIFGTKHPRAVDKFLRIVWDKNKLNGQANFDMDKEGDNDQGDLFIARKLTKIEKYESKLQKLIFDKKEITNKELYDFTLENGHIPKHTIDKIKKMKSENKIDYFGHPCISYNKCCNEQEKELKIFKVVK